MRKIPLTHQIIRLQNLVHVLAPDPDGHAHDHVLRAFGDLAVDAEEVGTFEGFEAELCEWSEAKRSGMR